MVEIPKDPEVQLRLIAEVTTALRAEGLEHWLFGGWGLDFLVGEVTRLHEDIDFFVWEAQLEAVVACLQARGFTFHPEASWEPTESVFVKKEGHYIELAMLRRRDDGEIVTPGRYQSWPWPRASFAAPAVSFRGISVPAFDARGHMYIKQGFSQHGSKEPLRPKDEADLVHLRRLVGPEA